MFKQLGYFKEYWVDKKSIGTILCEKDRDVIGYCGKRSELIQSDIILQNGRKLRAGTLVTTMIYPLCGKMSKG